MATNPRLVRATRGIQRRIFLKAVALGLSAAAASRLSQIAVAQTSPAKKRLFVFFMPHGIAPEHYNPQVSASDRTDFALDKTNVSILGPLEPYKQYVNVYQGFQYPGAAATHTGIVNCLSGTQLIDDTTDRVTMEHVIGKALGINPLILGACSHQPYGIDLNGKLFWNGKHIDPEKNPAKAADLLFGGQPTQGPAGAADMESLIRQDLLSLNAAECQELRLQIAGLTSEETKLAQHCKEFEALKAGGSTAVSSCQTRPTLPTVEMVRAASAGQVIDSSGGNDYFYQEKNFPLIFQAQLELVAQALICGAAPIIGLMPMYTTCEFDFSFAGAPGSHHNTLSHRTPEAAPGAQYNSPITVANYVASARAPFATAQLWFTQQLVKYVVSVLATTDDPTAPGTKVLDNTLIYCMSEIGDGANHLRVSGVEYPQVPAHVPLVTIGKCAGAIKSGQVVAFPIDKTDAGAAEKVNRPAADLYLTLARAMGAANATFPGTTGPVTEVLA